ncbi:MAG: Hsp20 family protein [Sulfurovum sp.]|nr:Hsp20 family protein [Sulfurovum sp.]
MDNFIDNGRNVLNSDFSPSVNTREGESAYHVEVDLPSVKKEDINVDVKDNMLTISGERKTKKKDFNYE